MRLEPRQTSAHAAGLGLLDVLIVVTILAILGAAAVPSLTAPGLTVDRAARLLVADMREAQGLAVAIGRPLGVRFDLAQHRYEFVLDDGRTPREAEPTLRADPTLPSDLVGRLVEARAAGEPRLADGVSLAAAAFGSGSTLMFEADGAARTAGLVDLQLGADRLFVRVQVATGRIAITEP